MTTKQQTKTTEQNETKTGPWVVLYRIGEKWHMSGKYWNKRVATASVPNILNHFKNIAETKVVPYAKTGMRLRGQAPAARPQLKIDPWVTIKKSE